MYHLGPHGQFYDVIGASPYPPAFGSVIPRVVCILKVTCYLKKVLWLHSSWLHSRKRGRQKKSLPVDCLEELSQAHFLIPIYISLFHIHKRGWESEQGFSLVYFDFTLGTLLPAAL